MGVIKSIKFDVIFVRHGVSCANMWKSKKSRRYTLYRDPELTQGGIKRSLELGVDKDNANESIKSSNNNANGRFKNLGDAIQKYWGENKNYIICSSPLIRAFQTAYYMMGLNNEKNNEKSKIHIIPAVSELSSYITTPDNNPLPFKPTLQNDILSGEGKCTQIKKKNENTQRKILCDIGDIGEADDKIIDSIGTDYRNYIDKKYKNSIDDLISFLRDSLENKNPFGKILNRFKNHDNNTIRLIIFTHSQFLLKEFPDVKTKFEKKNEKKVFNNEGIHTTFRLDSKPTFNPEDYIYYHTNRQKKLNEALEFCPDKCRKKVSNRWIVNKLFRNGSYCRTYNEKNTQTAGTRKKSTRRI